MATASGWTDRTFGSARSSRATARPAHRSLGAALREAGLSDAAPDPHEDIDAFSTAPIETSQSAAGSALAASRSPRLGVFSEQLEQLPRVVTNASPHQSVVSPPPWLRAKRRGRWRARMINTFGWAMTIMIAGSIIGLAAHILGIPPARDIATMQARQ
jgi:hypothetical protein